MRRPERNLRSHEHDCEIARQRQRDTGFLDADQQREGVILVGFQETEQKIADLLKQVSHGSA
ncbi:MAG: hypothetical protein OXG77_09200 [Chloroflexi bacterium]|nr:hypothetical protein [Chloroflexota bacterium]